MINFTLPSVSYDGATVSKMLADQWKELTDEEKQKYYQDAEHLKNLHQLQHPDYKYSPRARTKKKGSASAYQTPMTISPAPSAPVNIAPAPTPAHRNIQIGPNGLLSAQPFVLAPPRTPTVAVSAANCVPLPIRIPSVPAGNAFAGHQHHQQLQQQQHQGRITALAPGQPINMANLVGVSVANTGLPMARTFEQQMAGVGQTSQQLFFDGEGIRIQQQQQQPNVRFIQNPGAQGDEQKIVEISID